MKKTKEIITYKCDACEYESQEIAEFQGTGIQFPIFDVNEDGDIIGYVYDREVDLCNKCCNKLYKLFRL